MTQEPAHTPLAGGGRLRALLALVVCALIAAVVEIGVFNLDWVTSLASGEASTISSVDASRSQSVTSNTLTFSNINAKVASVSIQFGDGEWHDVTVNVMDESLSSYRTVGTIHESDQPLYLHTEGNTLSIRLDANSTTLAQISSITLNGIAPLGFSAGRWGVIALLLYAFWLIRPSSAWWRRRALDHRLVFPVCACVMCLVALAGAIVIGGSYSLDGNDSTGLNQYTDLARALASGHVYLDYQPTDELLALANPYDTALRDASADYLWDYAFFDGKYYTYFGVIPCLVFYLPFYLVTGGALPNIVVTAIAVFAFYIGCIYVVRRVIGRWFRGASIAAVVLCSAVALFGTISLSLVSLPTIYPVPIACGAACAIWGLGLWLRACEGERFLWGRALVGSLLGALTLGCRPQFFVVFLFVLLLFIDAVRRKLVKPASFFPLIAPIVVVGVLLCAYNYARFGSPFDFGSSYNLTNDNMAKHGLTPFVGALGIFAFLLQPPQIIADWPFVVGTTLSYAQNSDLVIEQTFGGIFAIAPLTLASLWFFWNRRLKQPPILLALSIAGVVCAVLLAVLDICAGGLILRYQVDMGLFVFLPACIGLLALTETLAPTSNKPTVKEGPAENAQYAIRLVLSALGCLSIAVSMLYFFGF